jgi:hypothetical protein
MTTPAKLNLCIPGIACRTVFFDRDQPTEKVLEQTLASLERDGYEPGHKEQENLRHRIDQARNE